MAAGDALLNLHFGAHVPNGCYLVCFAFLGQRFDVFIRALQRQFLHGTTASVSPPLWWQRLLRCCNMRGGIADLNPKLQCFHLWLHFLKRVEMHIRQCIWLKVPWQGYSRRLAGGGILPERQIGHAFQRRA